ncbi:hypothetical protein L208DRAFT_1204470, partial [Tricholoma matsutake]
CGIKGRRRDGDPHYFPVMSKPQEYTIQGCNHGDNPGARYEHNLWYLLASQNNKTYKVRRLETGLCKATLFSGLITLGVPGIFTMD